MIRNQLLGCKLKKDVMNSSGVVLIPEKTILTQKHLDFIEKHHIPITQLSVEVPAKQTNQVLVNRATEEIKEVFQYLRSKGSIPVEEIENRIIPAIHQAAEFPSLHSVLSGLQAKDDYTYRHNIGVGIIATLIGKWLELDKESLSLLTTAATLHDVGKIKIADAILNKPGKFTDFEYAEMKKHTIYGYEIVKNTPRLHPRTALVALQHHEREDGKGYPHGITGQQIDYFSKIVGVADVFHAMTSKRVYKEASPLHEVIKQMQNDRFGKLDPVICNLFVFKMMEMSIGNEVKLTDGRQGIVIIFHPGDPANPTVMSGNQLIDLRYHPDVNIERLIG